MENVLDLVGLEEAFGGRDVTSDAQRDAIGRWFRLYYGGDGGLSVPYTVVRRLTRAVFGEFSATGGEFAKKVLAGLEEVRCRAMELALIGGECYLKPVTDGFSWYFRCVSRRDILIFARDSRGEPTDIGTAERSVSGRMYFTLLERRFLEDGALVIENKLFRSAQPGLLGRQVPLGVHPLYAALPERFVFEGQARGLGLIRVKNPGANCVDGSCEGVSVYAPAVKLLELLEENEEQLAGEFRRGQSRIVVSADMLDGGELKDNVFVGLDDTAANVGVTVFAPELREQSYLNRKQAYLKDVENVLGLRRGLLANVDEVARTATEITTGQGEYALTILELQAVWQRTVQEAVRVCVWLAERYGMDAGGDEVELGWGDGQVWSEA